MTATAQQILKAALGLPAVDRAELIERLFRSFDASVDGHTDTPWSVEIESRIDAYDKGELAASPAEDVMARIGRR
jgi:putative addiction module component (TIGR02574 family)